MSTKILTFSFYLLFSLTPFLWAPWSFELFEYNKMMFVYLLTSIIATAWAIKMIRSKSFIFKTTPLDIPLLLLLIANLFSTIFSIDRHTSLWGYYSRSNGGLLSFISYLILYWALVSNFDKDQILKFLKAALFGGFLVSLWAIPEHFGLSPSCLILTGRMDASCWVQDVAARVFATLGQPNWLAAYLAMLIFPALYFLLTAKSKLSLTTYYLLLITYYLAFTFTYSRGASLGFLAGLVLFLPGLVLASHPKGAKLNWAKLKPLGLVFVSFLIINLFFGSALTSFKLLSKFAPPPRPALTTMAKQAGTQLESGGTESGQIRLIVWQGAWEIFKHYPIFGSGLETFAYSYYTFRPVAHNLVSEWDFLYNKAHNEFLNYLATTGIVGLGSYSIIIITFIISIIRLTGEFQAPLILKRQGTDRLLLFSLLASYISFLVQNFFGFSVVITALFFYLFPALVFVATGATQPLKPPKFCTLHFALCTFFPRHPKFTQIIILVISSLLFFTLTKNYLADIYFAQGEQLNDTNPGRAYNLLTSASFLNSSEPYYRSELGYVAALSSLSLAKEDAALSEKLKNQANFETKAVLKSYPKNVSYFRTAIRTYYLLSQIDPIFTKETLETFETAISLAPTDAKLIYNQAVVLNQMGKKEEAIKVLEKVLTLKPNYSEALDALEKLKAQ